MKRPRVVASLQKSTLGTLVSCDGCNHRPPTVFSEPLYYISVSVDGKEFATEIMCRACLTGKELDAEEQ